MPRPWRRRETGCDERWFQSVPEQNKHRQCLDCYKTSAPSYQQCDWPEYLVLNKRIWNKSLRSQRLDDTAKLFLFSGKASIGVSRSFMDLVVLAWKRDMGGDWGACPRGSRRRTATAIHACWGGHCSSEVLMKKRKRI